MSEKKSVYKVGHCPCCESQTLITDTMNRPIGFIPNTFACWMCLCDENGTPKTRVGAFVMCADCVQDHDPEEVWRSLIESPHSGLQGVNLPEAKLFPKKKIEVIKQYGI